MKRQWQSFAARYSRLSGRERLGILLAGATLLAALGVAGVMTPLLKDSQAVQQQRLAAMRQLAATEAQRRQLAAAQRDPDSQAQQQLLAAQQRLAAVDQALQTRQSRLVPAGQMAALLEQLLHANGRLKLVALKTLPAVPLSPPVPGKGVVAVTPGRVAGGGPDSGGGLFKHGVEIRIKGNYFDLLAYVQSVEQLPANLVWSDLRFKVDQYPINTLTLTLYTLSLDRIWLSV